MNQETTDLEIRFMHQERTIQELNDIVCRQELAIERLERDMRTLQEQVKQLARRLAAEFGVDVDALAARLPGKRIERADIEAEAKAEAKVKAETGSTSASTLTSAGAVLPITTVRRTIADRMAASAHTVAPVTLTTEADATELVRLRKQLKRAELEREILKKAMAYFAKESL